MPKIKDTLGGYSTIRGYVGHKMSQYGNSRHDMRSLFLQMFSEKENVLAERTDGYKIQQITYGESYERVGRKTLCLMRLLAGVPRGAMVGLCLENSLEWIEIFWSILQAGYKPLLMNMRLDDETLRRVAAEYGVAAVISEDKDFGVPNIAPRQLESEDAAGKIDPSAFEDEVFFMSSNTSSNLKICSYNGECFYRQIMDSAAILKQSRSIKRHDRGRLKLLAILPFYHVFGLIAVYIWFCFFSRTLVFVKDLAPETVINTVRKHRVTHIFAVPLLWDKLYKTAILKIKERGDKVYRKFERGLKLGGALNKVPFLGKAFAKVAFREVRENIFGESISFLINGGGYVSPEVMRFVNGIGYHLANGYGMTEIGITSVELSERASVRNLCSVGKPFRSSEYRISESGELLVRSSSMARKIYAGGECAETDKTAWFNTHDLFEERKGRYYILGRKDDLLICANGENLNPNMVEPLLETEGVRRLCLLNPTGERGRVALLAEVSRYIDRAGLEEIRARLTARIAELRLGDRINAVLFTETPLFDENDFKLVRKKIAQRLRAGEIPLVDPAMSESAFEDADRELAEKIRGVFAEALARPAEEIGDDAHFFFDLGGNSLDYFAMISRLQAEFGIAFPSNVETGAVTVNEIKDWVKKG